MGRLTRIRYRDRRDNGQITGSPTCRAIVRRNAAVSAWPLPDSISSELTADRFRIDDLTFPAFFMEDPGEGGAPTSRCSRFRSGGGTRLRVDHCQKEGIFRRRRPFLFTRWNDEVRDSFVPSPVTVRRTRRWFTSVEFLPEPRWDVPVWERFLGARNWVSNKVSDSSGSRINFIFGRNEKFGDCC